MNVSVSDVMLHVRNHFAVSSCDGTWRISGGGLIPSGGMHPGQWIAISGPDAPTGVYQLDELCRLPLPDGLCWQGRLFLLNPPAGFLQLCSEIADWARTHPDPTCTGEHLGSYSRSQQPASWQQVFAPQLQPYSRMFPEVIV